MITVTKSDQVCKPTVVTVTTTTTVVIPGKVIVPYCNNATIPTVTTTISSYTGAANKRAAGVAVGFASVAAAFL